jgi:hypothetical protein
VKRVERLGVSENRKMNDAAEDEPNRKLRNRQRIHDRHAHAWHGDWFIPQLHERYTVPKNSANHREYAGRSGTCVGRRFNYFGMSWALIHFDDALMEIAKQAWIRTRFLIEADD